MKTVLDTSNWIRYGKFLFPPGTAESFAEVIIGCVKKEKRVIVHHKSYPSVTGYPKHGQSGVVVLCFDARSRRGTVMGPGYTKITETRKPYKVLWDMMEDPILSVMET